MGEEGEEGEGREGREGPENALDGGSCQSMVLSGGGMGGRGGFSRGDGAYQVDARSDVQYGSIMMGTDG